MPANNKSIDSVFQALSLICIPLKAIKIAASTHIHTQLVFTLYACSARERQSNLVDKSKGSLTGGRVRRERVIEKLPTETEAKVEAVVHFALTRFPVYTFVVRFFSLVFFLSFVSSLSLSLSSYYGNGVSLVTLTSVCVNVPFFLLRERRRKFCKVTVEQTHRRRASRETTSSSSVALLRSYICTFISKFCSFRFSQSQSLREAFARNSITFLFLSFCFTSSLGSALAFVVFALLFHEIHYVCVCLWLTLGFELILLTFLEV